MFSMQMGCGLSDNGGEASDPRQATLIITSPLPTTNPKIPVEVSYPIINDAHDAFSSKRIVDVRLNMKVSPEVLREIALEVKSKEEKQYERTFVFVYLPELIPRVDNDAWATCHFNPTLEVKILGLDRETEDALRKTKIDISGMIIGAWLIDRQYSGFVAVLYEEGNQAKLAQFHPGGGRSDEDMIEQRSDVGRRFKPIKGNDVYEVDLSGILRIYNLDGNPFAGGSPLR